LKLLKEKKCFTCKKEGHRARECPSKGKTTYRDKDKGRSKSSSKAWAAHIEEVEEEDETGEVTKEDQPEDAPPSYDKLVFQVRALKNKE
jgi:hypothetical protein